MRANDGLDFAGSLAARVRSGRMSREEAEIRLAEELRADCPVCSATYDAALAALFGPEGKQTPGLQPIPSPRERMAHFLSEAVGQIDPQAGGRGSRERRRAKAVSDLATKAERALSSLRAECWARRRERVALEWHRFRGSEVARLFLGEARAALPGNPEDSGRWADLTLLALAGSRLELYPDPEEKTLLRLRSRLFQANTLRYRGDLVAANEEFALTLSVADELDLRDQLFWAEAKSFVASLRRAQRDFPAAVREARSAAALARAVGDERNEARARWQLASIHEQVGDLNAAVVAIRQAASGLSELRDPVLEVGVRNSEVSILARAGQFQEAAAAFERMDALYEQFPDRKNFKHWVSSLIAAGLGRPDQASAGFRAARDGFLADKNPYDAALVTLDWTLFLLDQDRAEEVLPLAVSMGQAFEGLGVARETLASWNVFAEAAARREVTRTAAEGLVQSLGTERSAPQRGR